MTNVELVEVAVIGAAIFLALFVVTVAATRVLM
jgi:hypothetical protein